MVAIALPKKLQVPGDGKNPVFWDSLHHGTYKQPDNMRRLRRRAVKDFGIRQLKRALYKQKEVSRGTAQ